MSHARRAVGVINMLFPSQTHTVKEGSNEDVRPNWPKEQIVVAYYGEIWLGYLEINPNNGRIESFTQNDHIVLELRDIQYLAEITNAYNEGIDEELADRATQD